MKVLPSTIDAFHIMKSYTLYSYSTVEWYTTKWFFTFVENNVVSYIVPNVSNKVHKFPFRFIYDMGE